MGESGNGGIGKGFFKNKGALYVLVAIMAILASLKLGDFAVTSARAADISDFERISPFSAKSLWLVRQARAIIETYQVDAEAKPITENQLVQGAIKGMVESWKDPYTRFVSPEQLKDEEIEMEGQYGGVGMYIGDREGKQTSLGGIISNSSGKGDTGNLFSSHPVKDNRKTASTPT